MEGKSTIRDIKPEEITKIEVFDFDGTLVDTLLPETGKPIWLEKTGKEWEHRGWWGRKESLDLEVFGGFEVIEDVIDGFKKAKEDPNTFVVMMTGRRGKLKNEVKAILDHHGLKFDKYLYNYGGDTLTSKLKYLGSMLEVFPNVTDVTLWDDRDEHIPTFEQWGDNRCDEGRLTGFTMHHVESDRH
jgi:hypothetical protein